MDNRGRKTDFKKLDKNDCWSCSNWRQNSDLRYEANIGIREEFKQTVLKILSYKKDKNGSSDSKLVTLGKSIIKNILFSRMKSKSVFPRVTDKSSIMGDDIGDWIFLI